MKVLIFQKKNVLLQLKINTDFIKANKKQF